MGPEVNQTSEVNLTSGGGAELHPNVTLRKNMISGRDSGTSEEQRNNSMGGDAATPLGGRQSFPDARWASFCSEGYPGPYVAPIDHFSGEFNENVEDFLDNIIDVAEMQMWTPEITYQQAASHLIGSARRWFRVHRRANDNWSSLKDNLRRDFGCQTFREDVEGELDQRAYKDGESFLRYAEDVLYLCNKVDSNMAEDTKVLYLISGFTGELLYTICERDYTTTDQFITFCRRMDRVISFQAKRGLCNRSNTRVSYGRMSPRNFGNNFARGYDSRIDNRYCDKRYDDYRYDNNRYNDNRYNDSRINDNRYEVNRYNDYRINDNGFGNSRRFNRYTSGYAKRYDNGYAKQETNSCRDRPVQPRQTVTQVVRNDAPPVYNYDQRNDSRGFQNSYRRRQADRPPPVCFYCNKPGHIARSCDEKKKSNSAGSYGVRSYGGVTNDESRLNGEALGGTYTQLLEEQNDNIGCPERNGEGPFVRNIMSNRRTYADVCRGDENESHSGNY